MVNTHNTLSHSESPDWRCNSYQGGADLVSFRLFIFPLHSRRAVRARHLARHHGAQHGAAGGERGARDGHRDGGQLQGQSLPVTHRQCRHLLSGRQLDDQHWGELAVILCTQSLILAAVCSAVLRMLAVVVQF